MKSFTGADVDSQQEPPVKSPLWKESQPSPTAVSPLAHTIAFLNNGQPKKVLNPLYDPT